MLDSDKCSDENWCGKFVSLIKNTKGGKYLILNMEDSDFSLKKCKFWVKTG